MALVCSVLSGREESERVIIHDNTASNGRALLKFGVCELLKRYEEVHVLLYEVNQENWVKGLPTDICLRITFHDFTSALLGEGSLLLPEGVAVVGRSAVVVDGLSFLLLRHSPSTLCRWVVSMSQLLCLVHCDLHEEGVLAQINYITTSQLRLWPDQQSANSHGGSVSIVHRKPSGKILRQTKTYSISKNFSSLETMDATHSLIPVTEQTIDPAANLTFDLHLSAREKAARSQVVLPYTSAQQEELVGITTSTDSGRIFYEPDALDSFEDSDPDEDLDF